MPETFREMFERIYTTRDQDARRAAISALPHAERAAWDVLALLNQRGGFDGWWGTIGDENQNEVWEHLTFILRQQQEHVAEDERRYLEEEICEPCRSKLKENDEYIERTRSKLPEQ
jgi:hypothetical protein